MVAIPGQMGWELPVHIPRHPLAPATSRCVCPGLAQEVSWRGEVSCVTAGPLDGVRGGSRAAEEPAASLDGTRPCEKAQVLEKALPEVRE